MKEMLPIKQAFIAYVHFSVYLVWFSTGKKASIAEKISKSNRK